MARFFQAKKNTQIEKKHQTAHVEKLDHQGAGIAYVQRKPTFIEGALPEETVLIQLTESKSKYARASLIKVLQASKERRTPFCPHYQTCGGCNLQHLDLQAQRAHKQQALSQLMSKFIPQDVELAEPIIADDKAYRRRARISLKWDKKARQLQFGFRRKQSHQIVAITHCPVLQPELNLLLPELKERLMQFQDQESLGHIELVKGDNHVVLALRHLKPLPDCDKNALIEFSKQHNLTLYLLPENNQPIHIMGEKGFYLETGTKIPFLPNNFIQVNQSINQQMVQQAIDWLSITPDDRILDLFCGLGNFSLPMSRLAYQVVGVEGVDEMVQQASDNALLNNCKNLTFFQANLEQDLSTQPWAQSKFDKVLLDPARAGAAGIVDQIANLGAKRVVYVSCNPATLARDSQSLLAQGYTLEKLGMLDMFPHTSHLESMALFIKDE